MSTLHELSEVRSEKLRTLVAEFTTKNKLKLEGWQNTWVADVPDPFKDVLVKHDSLLPNSDDEVLLFADNYVDTLTLTIPILDELLTLVEQVEPGGYAELEGVKFTGVHYEHLQTARQYLADHWVSVPLPEEVGTLTQRYSDALHAHAAALDEFRVLSERYAVGLAEMNRRQLAADILDRHAGLMDAATVEAFTDAGISTDFNEAHEYAADSIENDFPVYKAAEALSALANNVNHLAAHYLALGDE